jgi:hypothetical protein
MLTSIVDLHKEEKIHLKSYNCMEQIPSEHAHLNQFYLDKGQNIVAAKLGMTI